MGPAATSPRPLPVTAVSPGPAGLRTPSARERRHQVHGHRGGSVILGPEGLDPGRGPQLVWGLLQGALPHPARLLRAGLAAAHELSVLLHRGLRGPQHPLAGTLLAP